MVEATGGTHPIGGEPRRRSLAERVLCSPWVDKPVAVAWVALNVSLLWDSLTRRHGFPLVAMVATALVHNVLLLTRRGAERFATHPLPVAIAFASGNWGLIYRIVDVPTTAAIAPEWVTLALTWSGAAAFLWARISIGRSFGMLPAHRGIITGGAYRFVRHPIYAAALLMSTSYLLSQPSAPLLLLWGGSNLLNVLTALVEERFLESDPEYRAYRSRVTCRFVPFVGSWLGL